MTRISDMTSLSALPTSGALVPIEIGDGANYKYDLTRGIGVDALFINAATLSIPTSSFFQSSGYSTLDVGSAVYVHDAAVNSAYVTANPRSSFLEGGGRGFRLSLEQDITPEMCGAAADGVTDDKNAIQAAIALAAARGGQLSFTSAVYAHTGLTFSNKVRYRGATRDTGSAKGTVLLYTGTGDGVQVNNPINSSTAANISVEGITFKNQNRNAGKGCFADTGSTDLKFRQCAFIGSDRGLILDQAELVDVTECDFEAVTSQAALIWITNGADRTLGASAGFSNRISVKSCQLNGAAGTVLIADDGGGVHSYDDNNYNGGATHIRAAGVSGLIIKGGEFESATAAIVRLEITTLAGTTGTGSCSPVLLLSPIMVPAATQPCLAITAAGNIAFQAPFFGNSTSAKVTGAANAAGISSTLAQNGGGGATFDGLATAHWAMDNSGAITTNFGVTFASALGDGHEGSVSRVESSPFATMDIDAKGGTGGWQGRVNIRVSYNGNALFNALQITANGDGTSAASDFIGPVGTTHTYSVAGTQVVGPRDTGWSADTGTARKSANATYAAGTTLTYSAAYVQAEQTAMATRVAAIEAALQNIAQSQKAIKDALIAHGQIGT